MLNWKTLLFGTLADEDGRVILKVGVIPLGLLLWGLYVAGTLVWWSLGMLVGLIVMFRVMWFSGGYILKQDKKREKA
jgi:hypothetical protein